MMQRRFFSTAILAILGLTLCLPVTAQQTIKVGAVYAGSGNAAYFSKQVVQGVHLAVDQINAAGGLLGGRKIELLLEDDEGRPDISSTKMRKLVDSGAVVLLSLSGAASTMQNHQVAEETKTPELSVNIADPLFQLKNPYLFLTSMPVSVQLKTLVEFLNQNKYQKVALVVDNGAVGASVGKSFREGLKEAGIDIVTEQTLERGATDFIAQWQRIRSSGAQVVVDAAQSPGDQILFRRTYHRLGMKMPTIGTTGMGFPVFAQQLKDQVNGVMYIDMLDIEKPEFIAYKALYEKRYSGQEADLTNASGYDTMSIVVEAIKRSGSAEREAIRASLQNLKGYPAVLGARGTTFNFAPSLRWAFPPSGAVIRIYENGQRGRVIYRGN